MANSFNNGSLTMTHFPIGDYLKGLCGKSSQCLRDGEVILQMHREAPRTAITYTCVIAAMYVTGLILLWLHFVKQKYGQVIYIF